MGLRCKGCGSEEHVKNGLMRGKQRYRCRACGLNFTDTPPRGMPLAVKAAAVLLYVSGLSMNRTAKLLGVSTPTVQAWLERFAKDHAKKPEPEGRALVIELDEMGHYLKKNPRSSGSGKLGIVLQGGSWTGNAAVAIELPWSGSSAA
jgi:transposase